MPPRHVAAYRTRHEGPEESGIPMASIGKPGTFGDLGRIRYAGYSKTRFSSSTLTPSFETRRSWYATAAAVPFTPAHTIRVARRTQ